jgi:hypothetical protein
MHIAYSAVSTIATNRSIPAATQGEQPGVEITLRYQAYQSTCHKYRREIAAIQKYLPGWQPKFR